MNLDIILNPTTGEITGDLPTLTFRDQCLVSVTFVDAEGLPIEESGAEGHLVEVGIGPKPGGTVYTQILLTPDESIVTQWSGSLPLNTIELYKALAAGTILNIEIQWTPPDLGPTTVYRGSIKARLDIVDSEGTIPEPPSEYYNKTQSDARFALKGSGPGGGGAWGEITGDLSDQTDLQAALDAKADASNSNPVSPLSKLSPYFLETAVPFVQHKVPINNETLTIATFTGVGIVDMIWITCGAQNTTFPWDAVLRVETDGALLPDIEVDLGTLFMNNLDGHTGPARACTTEHMTISTMGDSGTGMSGGLKFPIPYSNGIVIKLFCPPGASVLTDDYSLFTQVMNRPNAVSNLRLRSNAVTWLNRRTYTKDDIITFFNLTNAAGWLVWQSHAIRGLASSGNTYDYLERIWFYGRDGEATVPDGNGVVTTRFSNSGGEDLFLYGWYFANAQRISGTPFTIVMATNNGNKTTLAGFDFLAAYGGLKFTTALKPGWSLKPSNVINNGHEMSWCFLFYIDTTVPFAPSAPAMSAEAGDAQVTLSITPPVSYGSSKVTGYVGTYSPGSGTFTVAANETSKVVTGLTNGIAYTFSLKAVNVVGQSTAVTAGATPSAAPVNPFPTITSATIIARYSASSIVGVADGEKITSWAKMSGPTSITLDETFPTSGPVYKVGILNSKPVLRFTGANFSRLAASASFNLAAPTSIIVVWKPTILSNNQVFDTYPGTAGHGRSAGGINNSGQWNSYAGASDAVSGITPTSAPHVLTMCQNGGNSYVSVDGVKGSTIDSGSGGFDIPWMGIIAPLDGDLPEFIVISGNLSDSDRHLIEVWAGAEYGFSVS